uniref:Protein kintoun n=1 Tax=Rhodnius prolixus TaxID=13249 RepID=T1HKY8_RHOPR
MPATVEPRELDISKAELKEIGEALKKEGFRNLLNEYFQEITDPKNKALYEKELTEFERERGVDVTFIHPAPGYVIKSSVDGKRKAFINICSNEKVDKPSSTITTENGTPGLSWSIPYLQGHPRDDLDKQNQYCKVFDVVFHPDTLHLAKKNARIRNLVNDIALSAVEDSFKVKLDRKNHTFPKMQYKGSEVATVIRKMRKDAAPREEESEIFAQCPYPYPPPKNEYNPKVTTPRINKQEGDTNLYTTPRYIIKHRRRLEMQEYTYAPDSKFHGAIPSDLVVEIDLPLASSAADFNLDIVDKSLCLISEKPAKYKLNVTLPYDVDDESGSAKFDKAKKKLIVVLPVKRGKYNPPDFFREDSGIESDANQNNCSSSEEDVRKNVELLQVIDDKVCEEKQNENSSGVLRTSEEVKSQFLNPDFHYSFPPNEVIIKESLLSFKMIVENIDPQSVAHQFVAFNEGVHVKFCSLGAGFFPLYYAFCIRIPGIKIHTSTLNIDVWDSCLNATINIQTLSSNKVNSYFIGTSLDSLKEKEIDSSFEAVSSDSKEDILKNLENQTLLVEGKSHENEIYANSNDNKPIESVKKGNDNINDENQESREENSTLVNSRPVADKTKFKNRTLSESNELPEVFSCGKRSILKGSRSLSESHTDDYNAWSSLDSESHEDLATNKKTVRFSDVVSKKIF